MRSPRGTWYFLCFLLHFRPREAPPEPPRRLRKALKQFESKEWALSSLSLYKVLEDPEAEYFHGDIRYYLAYCLEQMGLHYSALEEYNRFLAGADPSSDLLARGIKRGVSLARRMKAGWLLAPPQLVWAARRSQR